MDLSPDLRHHVSEVLRSESGRCTWTVPPNVRREARSEVEKFERLCRPIGKGELEEWMSFAFALPDAPPQHKKAQAVSRIYEVVCEVPAIAFDRQAQTRALRQWKWWPTPPQVHEVVRDKERELLSTLRALKQIVNAPKPRAVESDMPRVSSGELRRAFSDLRSKSAIRNGGA